MNSEIIEKLKQSIADYKEKENWEEVGKVVEVGDGIIKIAGLPEAKLQEILVIGSGSKKTKALALNLEEDFIGALLLGKYEFVKAGDIVKKTGEVLSIPVSEKLLSRVIDPLGNPLDGEGEIFSEKERPKRRPLENESPNVVSRESVNTPLHTGIKSIDSMIPIGRGQRELIIGDRQTGKTSIALDIVINQAKEETKNPVVCIYVAIGQKESRVAKIVQTLKNHNAFENTIVVSASASQGASLWYLAPFAGCAIGEYFRDKGKDALVIYDDLSKHAAAWRQISLLLRRPPGREAYPGDIFYLHSRILERSAKLSKEKGGGSLTAMPIIETQLGDVTSYIPTNVISITDGQIYLESDLFYQGVKPAINVGLSVSRVGSMAQTKAMKRVSGKLRLELAQSRELQRFAQFSADVDDSTKEKIKKGKVITALLNQKDLSPMPFENQVFVLYTGINGYFNDFDVEKMESLQKEFLDYIENLHKKTLETIKEEKDISEKTEREMKEAIKKFINSKSA